VARQAERSKHDAKPINDLVNNFNSLMDLVGKKGVSSTKDIDGYEKKFRALREDAERMRRGRSAEQGGKILGDLVKAVDSNLRQLGELRQQADCSAMLGGCFEEFNTLMAYYQRKPISNYNQAREAREKFSSILSRVQTAKKAKLGPEADRAIKQLEEALSGIMGQLNA
jgi:microsomal dipeptidase-like Zn-dependent dipeptidase